MGHTLRICLSQYIIFGIRVLFSSICKIPKISVFLILIVTSWYLCLSCGSWGQHTDRWRRCLAHEPRDHWASDTVHTWSRSGLRVWKVEHFFGWFQARCNSPTQQRGGMYYIYIALVVSNLRYTPVGSWLVFTCLGEPKTGSINRGSYTGKSKIYDVINLGRLLSTQQCLSEILQR